MIAIIIVLGVIIWKDANKEPEEIPNGMVVVPAASGAPAPSVQTDANTFSPEELRPLPEEEGFLPIFRRANTNDKNCQE